MRTLAFRIHFHMHIIVISFSLFFFHPPATKFCEKFYSQNHFLEFSYSHFCSKSGIINHICFKLGAYLYMFHSFGFCSAQRQMNENSHKKHRISNNLQPNELVYFCIKLENARSNNKPLSTWRISIIWLQSKTITEN